MFLGAAAHQSRTLCRLDSTTAETITQVGMFCWGNSGADLLVRSLSPPRLYNNLEYAELPLSQLQAPQIYSPSISD